MELIKSNKLYAEINKALKAEQDYINELKIRKSEFEEFKESFIIQIYDIQRYIDNISFVGEVVSSTLLAEDEF
ncbi:hypothetical protein [Clostridium septicum]|uniref:hypothetical protein n=1 Tax=Clostridium septicum TaxID=1504 RepID=UPI000FF8C025|nr:hypothetical protein [Clostridium septicum]QAS60539.1 hypothetical protein EI377_07185 [Clostridium septicum]